MFANLREKAAFSEVKYQTRLIHDSDDARIVVFGLLPGQVVPAHTSTSTVLMQVVSGQGRFGVGDVEQNVGPGEAAVCPPNVPHSMAAETEMIVLAVIAPRP